MTQTQRAALSISSNGDGVDHEIIDTPLLWQPLDHQQQEVVVTEESAAFTCTNSSDQENEQQKALEIEFEEQPTATLLTSSSAATTKSDANTKLPIPLLLLFGLYGLTMSLPTLPLMYILNTRVALPLSILPTYGALSFLPYSFKPLYAYWSSKFSRRRVLAMGWTSCAITSVGWTWVETTPWVFIMGISNGVAMAWSGFLLGLTLLDEATRQQHLQKHSERNSTSQASDSSSSSSSSSSSDCVSGTFETAASIFQSQAATARNVGSFAASILTCIIFGISHAQSKMNNQVTNALFLATAGCHVLSFAVVFCCRKIFAPLGDAAAPRPSQQGNPGISLSRPPSPPSYSSIEIYAGDEVDEEEEEEVSSQQSGVSQTSSSSSSPPPLIPPSDALPWDKNVILIGTLQVSVVVLALKGPILDLISHHPNLGPILGVTTFLVVALLAARIYYVSTSSSAPWKLSHMVGLVLMLRHAIPSTTSILSSFLYHCLRNQPVWLQVFSLVDNGVVTLSSWTYQKLFATRFSHGRKLIHFMMVTTVVASLADYLNVFLVRYYDDDVSNEEDSDGGASRTQTIFPWMVLLVKVADTFIGEWNFIPDVVLATVSVTVPTLSGAPEATTSTTVRNTTANEQADEELQRPSQTAQMPLTPPVAATAAAGVEYGSLISCIDFGDQLGTILATPIVSLLGITRENGWEHLDLMIQICTGLGILSVGFLTLLLRWFPREVVAASTSSTARS